MTEELKGRMVNLGLKVMDQVHVMKDFMDTHNNPAKWVQSNTDARSNALSAAYKGLGGVVALENLVAKNYLNDPKDPTGIVADLSKSFMIAYNALHGLHKTEGGAIRQDMLMIEMFRFLSALGTRYTFRFNVDNLGDYLAAQVKLHFKTAIGQLDPKVLGIEGIAKDTTLLSIFYIPFNHTVPGPVGAIIHRYMVGNLINREAIEELQRLEVLSIESLRIAGMDADKVDMAHMPDMYDRSQIEHTFTEGYVKPVSFNEFVVAKLQSVKDSPKHASKVF